MTDFAQLVLSADSRGLKAGELALDSLAAKAERSEGVVSKAMADIENSTGVAGRGLSALADDARKSADAFAHFARLESQIDTLAASIDPVYASSKRYEGAIEQLSAALDAGVISQQRYNTLLGQAERAYLGSPLDKMAADAAAYGSELDRLRMKFNSVYGASKAYEAELDELNRAHSLGAISAYEHGAALEALNARYLSAAGAANVFGKSAGAARMQTANLGYQIQDIGMMMAMGQNPFMLLAQQLPQITMYGGQLNGVMDALRATVAGLFSPLGLLTTAFVLGGSAAISYFSQAADEADTLEDKISDLGKSIDGYSDAVRNSSQPVADLIDKFGLMAETAGRVYDAMRKIKELEFQEALRNTRSAISETLTGLQDSIDKFNLASTSFQRPEAITAIRTEVQYLENVFGLTLIQATRVNSALEELAAATGPQEIADAAMRLGDELGRAREEGAQLSPELLGVQKSAYQASLDAAEFSRLMGTARDGADGLAASVGSVADEAARAAQNAAAMVDAIRAQAVIGQLDASPLNQFDVFNSSPFESASDIFYSRFNAAKSQTQLEQERLAKAGRKRGGSKKTDSMTDEMRDAARVYDETRTALEKYNDELADLQELQEMGYLSADTYSRAVAKVGEEYRNASEQGRFFNEMGEDLKEGILDVIFEGEELDDVLKSLAKSFARAALEAALFGTGPFAQTGGKGSGGGGGLLGGLFGGLMKLFSFDGGGSTGSGSRSGGVDGKGGFLGILHPNETVIDHTKGQGSGTVNAPVSIAIDATGADGPGLARVERQLGELERRLPGIIVGTLKDAQKRRVI